MINKCEYSIGITKSKRCKLSLRVIIASHVMFLVQVQKALHCRTIANNIYMYLLTKAKDVRREDTMTY